MHYYLCPICDYRILRLYPREEYCCKCGNLIQEDEWLEEDNE